MTIRVVHVASGREWRGGQKQVWLLARALARIAGVHQLVVTGRGSELARRLAHDGVRTRLVTWRSGLDPRALWATLRAARGDKPVILHAHDAHALTIAGIVSRLTGARLVVTRRVDFHLRHPGFWVRADRVIAISEAIRRIVVADGIPPERVTLVHSGIAVQEVRATPPRGIRRELGIPSGGLLAVNVGALVPHKDQATLIAAAGLLRDRLPNLYWVIAGEGELRPALERQIGDLNLADRIVLLGQIPDAVPLIADADLYVSSSREEGLGTSLLDAMALRVPVIATRAGGVPEIVGDDAGVLVPVGNEAALADAIVYVATDPRARERILQAASAVLGGFTDVGMAERVLGVYRSLVPDP